MEPQAKKVKITDHFRVALKPLDHNKTNKLALNKQIANNIVPSQKPHLNLNLNQNQQPQQQQQQQQQQLDQWLLSKPLKTLDQNTTHDLKQQPQAQPQPQLKQQQKLTQLQIQPLTQQQSYWQPSKPLKSFDEYYAWESYEYDKEREIKLRTAKYLDNQELKHQITPRLRARFIDWLILIQNDFRLDHEPLYMAVKLVDQYLMHKTVMKTQIELLFITSIFICVKFEYRPDYVTISELLREFGDKYHKKQVINYEIDILSTLNFDIRFPLSYGFLRRFARCTNTSLKTLTLARYILESSLLEYDMIDILESKKASASLLLANKMLFHGITWDEAYEFHTGYKESELEPLALQLNEIISRPFDRKLGAIRRKYTSEIFMSVANIAPLVIT